MKGQSVAPISDHRQRPRQTVSGRPADLPLAEGMFWLVRHDQTGAPRTSQFAGGVLLAAAVLGELVLAGAVGVAGSGHVVAVTPLSPALDTVTAGVAAQIAREPRCYHLGQWLQVLRTATPERVRRRIVDAGRATTVRSWIPGRAAVIAHAGDTGPGWVPAGLRHAVLNQRDLTGDQRVLLGLVWFTDIGHNLLAGSTTEQIQTALEQIHQLPAPWPQLIYEATTMIRDAAIVH